MSVAEEFKSRMIAKLKAKVKLFRGIAELTPTFPHFARGYIVAYAEMEQIHTSLIDLNDILKEVLK